MYNCIITFRSITGAQLGSALLHNSGVYNQMTRTPKELSDKGCGYAIRVPHSTLNYAMAILRQAGAPVQRVFCQSEDGRMEEWTL